MGAVKYCMRNLYSQLTTCSTFRRPLLNNIRHAATYEGDGKTSVTILNKDVGILMVDSLSQFGLRLNNGVKLIGPSIIFPHTVLSWDINGVDDISTDSLSLFSILEPKVDILIFGYGDKGNLTKELGRRINEFCQKNKISYELLPTEDACSTFNFLNSERRYVAAALIPPQNLKIYNDNEILDNIRRRKKDLFEQDSNFV